ncbi:TPA: hypothetical protein QDZ42_000822 [Stenotrophomonas maltophilia]|nr:hypothetical protein [Stenotrophomonas maltophilia]HDS1042199.1 hypothetical protein [Stenotrophomonas maltophilia]
MDLLARVGRFKNISDYRYIGFGGPFLEDFKAIHASLRLTKMMSIESDENVGRRQNFNKPLSCVEITQQTSAELVAEFDFYEDCIVWLDYTEPAKIGEQLAELEALVAKLQSGSVFKITINAAAAALGGSAPGEDLQKYRASRASKMLGDYGPAVISTEDVTSKYYPNLLLKAIEAAAKRGMMGRKGYIVVPLTCFSYSDGQTMLAVTGMVLRKSDEPNFRRDTRLSHWEFTANEWSDLREISVPAMSIKERIFVESMLPNSDSDEIEGAIGFHFSSSKAESSRLLANFAKYYRMYPWYSKVAV